MIVNRYVEMSIKVLTGGFVLPVRDLGRQICVAFETMGLKGVVSKDHIYLHLIIKHLVENFYQSYNFPNLSVLAAIMKSLTCKPLILCDHQKTVTFPHSVKMAG